MLVYTEFKNKNPVKRRRQLDTNQSGSRAESTGRQILLPVMKAEALIGQLYPAILIATLAGMALQVRFNAALKGTGGNHQKSRRREFCGQPPSGVHSLGG
jgi:hypothetical protein